MQTTRSLGGGHQGGDDHPELLSMSDTDSDDESVFDIHSDEDVSALTEGKFPDALHKRGTVQCSVLSFIMSSLSRQMMPRTLPRLNGLANGLLLLTTSSLRQSFRPT